MVEKTFTTEFSTVLVTSAGAAGTVCADGAAGDGAAGAGAAGGTGNTTGSVIAARTAAGPPNNAKENARVARNTWFRRRGESAIGESDGIDAVLAKISEPRLTEKSPSFSI